MDKLFIRMRFTDTTIRAMRDDLQQFCLMTCRDIQTELCNVAEAQDMAALAAQLQDDLKMLQLLQDILTPKKG